MTNRKLRTATGWLLVISVCTCWPSFGQEVTEVRRGFNLSANYTHNFLLDGLVRVREWEVVGDKLNLEDLGIDHFPSLNLELERIWRRGNKLALATELFFIHGRSIHDRDIAYNGTLIDGTKGIDISPTHYYRLSLTYYGIIYQRQSIELHWLLGVVVDHIKFYLQGDVSVNSKGYEVFENFGRQAFPYPVTGLRASTPLGEKGAFNMEISGTYIPKFKSFYTEGGHMYLHYRAFLADFRYPRRIAKTNVAVGTRFHYIHLFQESAEDTNILDMSTVGPYIEVSRTF